MATLITGGSGYIGSHTVLQLLKVGIEDLVIIDNFSNSSKESIRRVEQLTGKSVSLVQGDIRDASFMDEIMSDGISTVIHFAGLKAVGESTQKPIEYYDNNVNGTLTLLAAMKKHAVKNIIFSSSATVYGNPQQLPITEETATGGVTNPYGRSKLHIEEILQDVCHSDADFKAISLRYFNPVGADKSGNIGEDPNGTPNNLMPYITQVAVGKLEQLTIFGNDYDTPDGTGVRDYIHVVDLAGGHVAALQKIDDIAAGFTPINLGTGTGYSVLEMQKAFETMTGKKVKYQIGPRRQGDIASCYAATDKAKNLLGWQAQLGLEDMCEDAWRWQERNPQGYAK